jgi:MFS transporter, DHA2 family, multidrug resistance protein
VFRIRGIFEVLAEVFFLTKLPHTVFRRTNVDFGPPFGFFHSSILSAPLDAFTSRPTSSLTLLKNRNFANACMLFFLFGFILFCTTVLLPQLLQTLNNYDATTAGMVLTPGAIVIVLMAPFIVRLTPIVGAKRLILIGFGISVFAVWHLGQLTLSADYWVFARARMLQGFGLGFLIVAITQVAYSYLPLEKNNKASSLTNLFRNEGDSFGITFANTILAQRAQFHQSILAQHATPDSSIVLSACSCPAWLE